MKRTYTINEIQLFIFVAIGYSEEAYNLCILTLSTQEPYLYDQKRENKAVLIS